MTQVFAENAHEVVYDPRLGLERLKSARQKRVGKAYALLKTMVRSQTASVIRSGRFALPPIDEDGAPRVVLLGDGPKEEALGVGGFSFRRVGEEYRRTGGRRQRTYHQVPRVHVVKADYLLAAEVLALQTGRKVAVVIQAHNKSPGGDFLAKHVVHHDGFDEDSCRRTTILNAFTDYGKHRRIARSQRPRSQRMARDMVGFKYDFKVNDGFYSPSSLILRAPEQMGYAFLERPQPCAFLHVRPFVARTAPFGGRRSSAFLPSDLRFRGSAVLTEQSANKLRYLFEGILHVALNKGIENLVFPEFGVKNAPPWHVAVILREVLMRLGRHFRRIVFAFNPRSDVAFVKFACVFRCFLVLNDAAAFPFRFSFHQRGHGAAGDDAPLDVVPEQQRRGLQSMEVSPGDLERFKNSLVADEIHRGVLDLSRTIQGLYSLDGGEDEDGEGEVVEEDSSSASSFRRSSGPSHHSSALSAPPLNRRLPLGQGERDKDAHSGDLQTTSSVATARRRRSDLDVNPRLRRRHRLASESDEYDSDSSSGSSAIVSSPPKTDARSMQSPTIRDSWRRMRETSVADRAGSGPLAEEIQERLERSYRSDNAPEVDEGNPPIEKHALSLADLDERIRREEILLEDTVSAVDKLVILKERIVARNAMHLRELRQFEQKKREILRIFERLNELSSPFA